MSPNLHQPSAKIYQFPKRGMIAAGARRSADAAANDPRLLRIASADCGGGWYHQAAIDEDRKTDKI